jgi:hypothetical protein
MSGVSQQLQAPGVLAYGMERRGDDERHDPSLAGPDLE